jgi:hypothetical protein
MEDFFAFRRMITPVLIQVVFWLAVVLVVLAGGYMIVAEGELFAGLALVFLGPLGVRVYCELLILLFRMNETLTDIKNAVEMRS